ncbi:Acyl-CoA dehydrogenase [Paraconexibacter sp. AEG42_29]|uniref:Acyl-[acyl-carrier-protein] dehydrogenase MbtN n=1 Tax=Paraconexibacter sp. AEG42_29 TaxID=2997339 RepID=A0AAU7B0F4_9ACTN
MRRTVYTPEHEAFRVSVRRFFETEVVPEYLSWEATGTPPRWFWKRCGELGILGIGVPDAYGGKPGATFKHSAIVTEEAQRLGLTLGGLRVQTDICMPYFLEYGTAEQHEAWLPRLTSGDAVCALAMSEPAAGSDMKAMATRARRDGDYYVVDGGKTFITNGLSADLVVLAVKTDPEAGRRGISLLVVEAASDGFERGRKLEKIGLRTQDLSELFFTDMVVPASSRLGDEGRGFEYMTNNLAQERLSIALNAQAAAVAALDQTVAAVQRRTQDEGAPDQATKFALAGCHADVAAGQALADRALDAHEQRDLDPADAAAVKLFCTELQGTVADRCLQVLGAAAYNRVDPVGRAFADARVSRIYGGSTEIMKVIVAKAMGL